MTLMMITASGQRPVTVFGNGLWVMVNPMPAGLFPSMTTAAAPQVIIKKN